MVSFFFAVFLTHCHSKQKNSKEETDQCAPRAQLFVKVPYGVGAGGWVGKTPNA